MNEIVEKDVTNIENMIYEFNEKEVMLDSDLANLYNVETKRINEAVKNNPEKFPSRFSWILTDEEKNNLRSKFSTTNISSMSRSNPRVFTEQGVYMLATILKSKKATEVSIRIMDTFVKMRHYIRYNEQLLPRKYLLLEEKVDNNTKRIDELFDRFNPKVITKNSIFYKNDIYDAYSVLMEIFKLSEAKSEIIIIDNYINKEVFDILWNVDRSIIVIIKSFDDILVQRYIQQYSILTIKNNNLFHDRYIILDRKTIYIYLVQL